MTIDSQESPLAPMDPPELPPQEEVLDIVEETSIESFPASDAGLECQWQQEASTETRDGLG